MPHIEINTWEGKSTETKRIMVQEITKTAVAVLGIKPEMVSVIIREIPKANWAVGGVLDADRDYES